jgi:hypothetical protein
LPQPDITGSQRKWSSITPEASWSLKTTDIVPAIKLSVSASMLQLLTTDSNTVLPSILWIKCAPTPPSLGSERCQGCTPGAPLSGWNASATSLTSPCLSHGPPSRFTDPRRTHAYFDERGCQIIHLPPPKMVRGRPSRQERHAGPQLPSYWPVSSANRMTSCRSRSVRTASSGVRTAPPSSGTSIR